MKTLWIYLLKIGSNLLGRISKKFNLGFDTVDNKTQLQLKVNQLDKIINSASALRRIMQSNDWTYVSNIFLEIQNDALTSGKMAKPEDDATRQTAMAKLNAIDEFNIKVHNILMKGEDALKQLPGLKDKLNNLSG